MIDLVKSLEPNRMQFTWNFPTLKVFVEKPLTETENQTIKKEKFDFYWVIENQRI